MFLTKRTKEIADSFLVISHVTKSEVAEIYSEGAGVVKMSSSLESVFAGCTYKIDDRVRISEDTCTTMKHSLIQEYNFEWPHFVSRNAPSGETSWNTAIC